MKNLDLGQAIGVLANIGVIAGIVFLAFELQQNNELLQAQSSFSQRSVDSDRRNTLIQDPGLIEVLVKASSDEALTPDEQLRLMLLNNEALDGYRWQFREYQAGRLPDNYLDLRVWRDVWEEQPGLYDLFLEDRPWLNPDFVEFIEQNIVNQH